MDQFRQIGEVLGGMKALMVLQNDIQINRKQCCVIFDISTLAFETISDMIKQHLQLEEPSKWKPLEQPLKELQKIFKEFERYIHYCLEIKDFWGKVIILHQNKDCVEFHIHNLLSCFSAVVEAIEVASESFEEDKEGMQKRKFMFLRKYDFVYNDQNLFLLKFGKQYLVPREICNRIECCFKEDKWLLLDAMSEKLRKRSCSFNRLGKNEQILKEFLVKKLNGYEKKEKIKLLPSSILLNAKDYSVKRRLDSDHKEIHWLGESFALKTFFGEIDEHINDEISIALSISHPNILQHLCGFYDDQKKEGFLLMELMQKSLSSYIKENSGNCKRVPFTVPVAVDIMLQIARAMEHLHSRKIYHGELNPENILLKSRTLGSNEGYFSAKVKGFCLTSIKSTSNKSNEVDPVIWYAPEVLAEQEQNMHKHCSKYTEKADVYSFAMLCFELLTGKLPFEDDHLKGDKMVRNIQAGERPLFPYNVPKYLANLTRKCWQTNPFLRPSFSAICRVLRYIKKVLAVDPSHGQPPRPSPIIDYCDLEIGYARKFPEDGSFDLAPVSQIPFQMFSYKLVEKARTSENALKEKNFDFSNELLSLDDRLGFLDDVFPTSKSNDRRSVCSEIIDTKGLFVPFNDQRSVFSEAPQRKTFSVDQASNFSESPIRKFKNSISGETPERKLSKRVSLPRKSTDSKLTCYEIPEEKGGKDSSNGTSPGSQNKEEIRPKSSLKKTKKLSLPTTMAAKRSRCPLTSKAETQNGIKISEKKNIETNTQKPESSKIVEKNDASKKVRHKVPEVKPVLTKTVKSIKTSTGSPKQESPSASPARTFKGNNNSPGASPARSFNGYASPRASPLNPCVRCTKTNTSRESPLPSGLNPSRRPKW